jgi:hypothetical protein
MHETNLPNIKAYIDEYTSTKIRGWTLATNYSSQDCVPAIKARINNVYDISSVRVPRRDVAGFYADQRYEMCGWEIQLSVKEESPIISVELFAELTQNNWTPFTISNMRQKPTSAEQQTTKIFTPKLAVSKAPAFLVIDNVYDNPDEVREFALSQVFTEHKEYHKGHRTDQVFRFPGLKELFERRLGVRIKNWDKYGTNGCFQYCIAGDQLVYHCDQQEYAGVLFLTPDAPPNTGSSFYRSKHTRKMKVPNPDEHATVFRHGYLDSTEFELVDTVGNVYNRIVLFDSKMIHSASEYFGVTKENGRLFQLFFFDLDI